MEIYLSICIPTYNRVDKLKEMLNFLEEERIQYISNIEVIVSNNFSNDGTRDYLNSISCFSNLSIYNQSENLGLIGNIRFLQKVAKGKYLWFIGDDDRLESGIFDEVLHVINKHPEIHHIFINYAEKANSDIIREKMYHGNEEYFIDGFKLFEKVAADSELGALMFLTSNIYLKHDVDIILEHFDSIDEGYNLALPLGYSLFCSQYPGFIIRKVFVYDEIRNVSWKDKMILVWCRDMIAICDVVGNVINKGNYVRKLILKHLPKKYPEIMYAFFGRNFNRDNYALKMYLKNFKIKLITDVLSFPMFCTYKILQKIYKYLFRIVFLMFKPINFTK